MLSEKKFDFMQGRIDKHRYMEEMFIAHRYLFEYPQLISTSPIKKIEITEEQVVFTADHNGDRLLICCDGRDAYSLPLLLMNLSACEDEEFTMMLKLIKEGDSLFLIYGANVGWHTINLSLKRQGIAVYYFEPIESSYNYLKKNLALNNLNSDKAYNIGISDENKKVKFYFDVKYAMASSMANLRDHSDTVEGESQVFKLDDFVSTLPSLEKLDFIKCDVEGAELLVFRGALETIRHYKPIIFTEMLRKWSAKFNYHPMEIVHLLKGIGYQCFIIHKENLIEFIEMDENTSETNFIFLHRKNIRLNYRKCLCTIGNHPSGMIGENQETSSATIHWSLARVLERFI